MLDPVELISRFTAGRLWKCTQIVECAASEFNGLRIDHWTQYTKLCMIRQLLSTGSFYRCVFLQVAPRQPTSKWRLAILELDCYLQDWHFSGEYASARDNLHDEANRRQNY
jgi:hypothetical protein